MVYLQGEVKLRALVFVSGLTLPGLIGVALSRGSAPAAERAWCSDPRVDPPGQGYQVGLPEGWRLEARAGITVVRKGAQALAFVYRAQAGDPPPPRLVSERIRRLAGSMDAEMSLDGSRLQGSSGGVPLEGEIFLEVHGPDLILAGGWAPTSQWGGLRAQVEEVGRCYRRSGNTSG